MEWIAVVASSIAPTLTLVVVAIIIEHVGPLERITLPARVPGVMMNVAQAVFSAMLIWPVARLWEWLGIGAWVTVPLWRWLEPFGWTGRVLEILILVLIADFLAYWRHRAEHAWFWPIHAVHHAPTELHAANDIGHPAQVLFSFLFITIPGSLIAFSGPEAPASVLFVITLLSFYIHSPIELHFGPLRKVLVDNRFHRIHHSLEERHFDKNFSICFSVWDRLFGTAYDPAPGEWPAVGLAAVPAPRTLTDYLVLPWWVVRAKAGARADEPGADACLSCAPSSPRS